MAMLIIHLNRIKASKGVTLKLISLLFLLVFSFNSYGLFDSGNKDLEGLLESEKNTINVFRNNARSVVFVSNIKVARPGIFDFFHQHHQNQEVPAGAGSGFVWDKKGHIVTNYHVVANGDKFVVTFHKDKEQYPAEIVGVESRKDLGYI